MVMASFAYLHEEELAVKMVNDLLPAAAVPPFDRVIILATSGDDPVWASFTQGFFHGPKSFLFFVAQMDIAFELSRTDAQTKFLIKVFNEAVNEMIGSGITTMDERVMAYHGTHLRISFLQGSDVWIVLPQSRARGAHIR